MEEFVAELERLSEADQHAALALGRRGPAIDDPALRVRSHRALGNAHRALSQLQPALDHYDEGIRIARQAGLSDAESLIRMSRAGAHSIAGDRRRAMTDLRHADRLATGAVHARVLFQRAVVVQRFSEGADALAAYDTVIPLLEHFDDRIFLAHAIANRGLLRTYQGDPDGAQHDLETALDLYRNEELPSPAAVVVHNLGVLRTRLLDLPGAMADFDEAEQLLRSLRRPLAGLRVDRAEGLIAAGLVDDAFRIAKETITDLERLGLRTDLAEALLVGAQAAALLGIKEANVMARRAAAEFDRQARPGWRDRASLLELELTARRSAGDPSDLARARRLGKRLVARGLRGPAARAAVVEGELALAAGRPRLAIGCIQRADWARRSGLLEDRLAYWQLRASLRSSQEDTAGTLSAARRGLRDLDLLRERMAAPDARTGIAIHADRLITTGLRAARRSRRRDTLFRWAAETAEAYVDQNAAVGDDLAVPLAELRRLTRQLVDAGEPERSHLLALSRTIEAEVQRRSRRRVGSSSTKEASFTRLLGAVEGRQTVFFVEIDGVVHRSGRDGSGRYEAVEVGDAADLARQTRSLQALFRRIASMPTASTVGRLERATHHLGEQLIGDLSRTDADVVLVPRGPLALVPWMALPQLEGRSVSVGFSLSSLDESVEQNPPTPTGSRTPTTTVIAGPRLQHSLAEAERIARSVDGVEVIGPNEATAAAAIRALEQSSTVHFACHGHFRSDNPLFSYLELADGPLTVHDILALGRPIAQEVVLSSCSGAEVSSRPERAFTGMSGGFLAAGIRTLIASVAPVPDSTATHRLMADYHRRRQAGVAPSVALQTSRAVAEDPIDRWQAGSFLTIGTGWR